MAAPFDKMMTSGTWPPLKAPIGRNANETAVLRYIHDLLRRGGGEGQKIERHLIPFATTSLPPIATPQSIITLFKADVTPCIGGAL